MKGTAEDRETLRNRVKSALGERTQKDLEVAMSVSGGTLTRVFGGRRKVDAELLESMGAELGMSVHDLVEGTSFATLVGGEAEPEAAPEPEPIEEPEATPEPVEAPLPDPEPEAAPEPTAEPEPAPDPAPAEPEPAAAPQVPPEPEPEPEPQPAATHSEPETYTNGHAAPPRQDTRASGGEEGRRRPGIVRGVLRFFSSLFGG